MQTPQVSVFISELSHLFIVVEFTEDTTILDDEEVYEKVGDFNLPVILDEKAGHAWSPSQAS